MPIYGTWVHTKPGYKQVGEWGYDQERLHKKIDKEPDKNGCLNWQGSMSPSGALMGAWKNGRQQMTQARRLVQMDLTNEDISEYQVKLSCGNQRCCNPEHFKLEPNNRNPNVERQPKVAKQPVPTKKIRPHWTKV